MEREVVRCACGRCQAVCLDDLNAIYTGPCMPLAIDRSDIASMLRGGSMTLTLFRIAANARTFRRVDDEIEKRPGGWLWTGRQPASVH